MTRNMKSRRQQRSSSGLSIVALMASSDPFLCLASSWLATTWRLSKRDPTSSNESSCLSFCAKQYSGTPTYTYGTTLPTWSPVANQAQLYFQFVDPITRLPVAIGNVNGKILRVYGSWGFMPSVSKFMAWPIAIFRPQLPRRAQASTARSLTWSPPGLHL